jgi:hypothetical protein
MYRIKRIKIISKKIIPKTHIIEKLFSKNGLELKEIKSFIKPKKLNIKDKPIL